MDSKGRYENLHALMEMRFLRHSKITRARMKSKFQVTLVLLVAPEAVALGAKAWDF